jgi:hypothetical protein
MAACKFGGGKNRNPQGGTHPDPNHPKTHRSASVQQACDAQHAQHQQQQQQNAQNSPSGNAPGEQQRWDDYTARRHEAEWRRRHADLDAHEAESAQKEQDARNILNNVDVQAAGHKDPTLERSRAEAQQHAEVQAAQNSLESERVKHVLLTEEAANAMHMTQVGPMERQMHLRQVHRDYLLEMHFGQRELNTMFKEKRQELKRRNYEVGISRMMNNSLAALLKGGHRNNQPQLPGGRTNPFGPRRVGP